ncbi:MAG: hypothetical protein M0C28_18185 [Candidatus Moduliflexus flocculans]|nr:hypothetical protein [Candidatus Moduliflexus flocculans]
MGALLGDTAGIARYPLYRCMPGASPVRGARICTARHGIDGGRRAGGGRRDGSGMLELSVAASPTRRLVAYMLRYRRGFALGLACTALSTVASLASPWVLKHAVDDLAQGVTGAKLRDLREPHPRPGPRRGRLPVPDAPHHRRRVAAPRVRPAQRLLRAAADARRRPISMRTAPAT